MMLIDTFDEFDRLSSAMFSALTGTRSTLAAPMDLRREGDRYVLETDLPGVDPASIDVSLDGQWLTISAERSSAREHRDTRWLVRERTEATVQRRVAVSRDIETDAIEAQYRDGVLQVVLPIAEAARPRRIAVTTGPVAERQAISAGTPASTEPAEGKAQPAHSPAS